MAAYEVLLLNTAIPQIQAAQSGDTYVVPRDIAFSAALTLSAGTANGVPYLNGSKVVTTGSALTFDGTNFYTTAQLIAGAGSANANVVARSNVANGGAGFSQFLFGNTSSDSRGYLSYSHAADSILFGSAGGTRMTLNDSGNLGLGVVPSTGGYGRAFQIDHAGNGGALTAQSIDTNNYPVNLTANAVSSGATTWKYVNTDGGSASRYQQVAGIHSWYTAPSGTAGDTISFTQAMTLDASGNLLVGETARAYLSRFTLSYNATTTNGPIFLDNRAFGIDNGGALWLGGRYNSSNNYRPFGGITARKENATDGNSAGYLTFQTNGNAADTTERARITSGGYFKASNTGTYDNSTGAFHEFNQSSGGEWTLYSKNTAASNSYGLAVFYSASAPNGTTNQFLYLSDSAQLRAEIRSNGGLANFQANDVNLSDMRAKKDVVPAPSYWDKIKGIEIVHFKYKDQTHDDNNVGVIAQQVEQVAPEFVDQDGWGETPEDGVPLKSIYTSDMYHAAIKALQEAMTRIETLEAEVAALKGA